MDDDLTELVDALEDGGYQVAFAYTPTPEQQQEAADRLAAQDMELGLLAGTLPPALIEFDLSSRQRQIAWDERADPLWLLTPAEYEQVPDGSVLVCINGKTKVKGTDYIDLDTRGGYIAHGFLDSQLPLRRTPVRGDNP